MRRARLLPVAFLLLAATPARAFAQPLEPVRNELHDERQRVQPSAPSSSDVWTDDLPTFALTFEVGGGVGTLSLADPLDRARGAHHYDGVPSALGGGAFALGVEVYRFVLEGEGQFFGVNGDDSEVFQSGGYVSVGYRANAGGPWVLTPMLGVGQIATGTCVNGHPAQAATPNASAFDQVLATPGPSSCLHHERLAARAALGIDYRGTLSEADGPSIGWFAGLRLQGMVPLTDGAWSLSDVDAPSFAGPGAPVMGFMVGLTVGIALGVDADPPRR